MPMPAAEPSAECVQTHNAGDSDSMETEKGLIICSLNKCHVDADVAGPETTFEKIGLMRPWVWRPLVQHRSNYYIGRS